MAQELSTIDHKISRISKKVWLVEGISQTELSGHAREDPFLDVSLHFAHAQWCKVVVHVQVRSLKDVAAVRFHHSSKEWMEQVIRGTESHILWN